MSRIAIGCIYDNEGIIDDYKIYLLECIRKACDKIIIVTNGIIKENYKERLLEFCENIYFRADIGADAGAFQDYFMNRFNDKSWRDYDEVITFNDSCYGPFMNIERIFSRMEEEDCDYWGMIEIKKDGASFISPYFNVYRKKLLQNDFIEFWKQLDVGMERCNLLCENYEIGMQKFFEKRGYSHKTWMQIITNQDYDFRDMYKPDKMLVQGEICNPLLKYKMFSFAINPDYEKLISYIDDNYVYDVELIKKHISRIENKNRLYPFSREKLNEFFRTHNKIYIYGHGEYGRNIAEYCRKHNLEIAGFVVSEKKSNDELALKDLVLKDEDGIVVGVGMGLRDEIEEKLLSLFSTSQLLLTVKY